MQDVAVTLRPVAGMVAMVALAWWLSERRRPVPWRLIAGGIALQVALGLLLLKVPQAQWVFGELGRMALALQSATEAGTSLVFGFLGGAATPFDMAHPEHAFVLAFRALPMILVISAVAAVLFHWQILPLAVRAFATLLRAVLGTGGPPGLAAAANVFVGMTEAPLLIRPYLGAMSRGALFAVMVCGMSTVAGTVMFLYATVIEPVVPGALGHILTASVMSAPAALLIAGVMIPDTGPPQELPPRIPRQDRGTLDAVTRGTLDAIPLWLHIIAMLIVMVALVHLVNACLMHLPRVAGEPLSAQRILGWVMAPLAWLIGIPWSEAVTAGGLIGMKTVLNEMVAYLQMAALPEQALSERSLLIVTYALCGFANFGSLGIMIGGLGAIAPERRGEIVSLGLRSMVAGTLATLMTGAVVALLT